MYNLFQTTGSEKTIAKNPSGNMLQRVISIEKIIAVFANPLLTLFVEQPNITSFSVKFFQHHFFYNGPIVPELLPNDF